MSLSIHHPRYEILRVYLKALRKGARLTQAELARRLEIDQSHLSKIERGERYMDVLLYIDWCRACGVDPGEELVALAAKGI